MMLQNIDPCCEIIDTFTEFPDLERMLSGLTVTPQTPSTKTAKAGIDTLIYLKSTMKLLANRLMPTLRTLVAAHNVQSGRTDGGHNKNSLVESFIANFEAGGFASLSGQLEEVLTDSTAYSPSAEVMRHQECFALKAVSDDNGNRRENGDDNETTSHLQILLAVARTSFLQCVEDIHLIADKYSQQLTRRAGLDLTEDSEKNHRPPKEFNIKVKYSSLRGYHLIIPAALGGGVGGRSLPEMFVQPIMHTNSIACTTSEVSSLSDRAQESISSALSLTQALIRNTVENIRLNFLKDLHAFVDSVSLMDMLLSFTTLVHHSASVYCRPTLTTVCSPENGLAPAWSVPPPLSSAIPEQQSPPVMMLLEKSRHPIISELSRRRPGGGRGQAFVENSILIDNMSQVQIITGVNGCGKSTLIKQVALITILAQIGCFVPCVSAVLPLRDRIFSRLSSQDDMENNLSTFHLEMKETAYILDNVTDESLVIIDELGRGSSNVDGLALAFAACEHLAIHCTAFTLFVTHFRQVTQLASLYPNVQNIHLKTELHVSGGVGSYSNNKIVHHYSLYLGPFDIQYGYGILVSEHMSLDSKLVADAKRFQAMLQKIYPLLLGDCHADALAEDKSACFGILRNLVKHFGLLKGQNSAASVHARLGLSLGLGSLCIKDCRQFFLQMKSAISLQQHQNIMNIISSKQK